MEENKEELKNDAPDVEFIAKEKKEKKAQCEDAAPTEELEALRAEVKRLEGELAELGDKHLRMAAEYDNFRRRSREEKEATYGNAMADTVAELLPIFDNLELAAKFEGDKVAEGLKMISTSIANVLEKLGVEKFGEPGDTFDPNLHNAVMHDEDEERGEGEITDVFQKGYKRGNRIIRFAMVKSVN